MKTLTGIIALMLALLFGASNAVFAAEKTATPAAPAAAKKTDKASPELTMTGKVTEVNMTAKTFTVISKGKSVTFAAAKLKALPKVGEIIDITYTQTPGGPAESSNLNSSRSNIY
jgi:hypothetical protein